VRNNIKKKTKIHNAKLQINQDSLNEEWEKTTKTGKRIQLLTEKKEPAVNKKMGKRK